MKTFNVNNKKELDQFVEFYKNDTGGPQRKTFEDTELGTFVKHGKTMLSLNKDPVLNINGDYTIVKNGIPSLPVGVVNHPPNFSQIFKKLKSSPIAKIPGFVIIPWNDGKTQKYFALLNGDQTVFSEPTVDQYDLAGLECATISFECLRRFYTEKTTVLDIAKKLAKEELKFLDSIPDHMISLSKSQKELEDKSKLVPPKPGYTLLYGERWHRSCTALFYDTKKKFSILLGQDEGSYFGVELADNPKSVEAAFASLMPKEVRVKKKVARQGEWFLLPIAKKDLPEENDILLTLQPGNNPVNFLGRESEESNKHFLDAKRMVVAKNGIVYAEDPILTHDDHKKVSAKGWIAFHKNTAVRSYSVQGVD